MAEALEGTLIRAAAACAALALATSPAAAELVPVDLFAPGDELSSYDTATGLEWLDLRQTVGYSFLDIAAGQGGWGAAGWRPATTDEVCALLAAYAAPFDPCPGEPVAFVAPTPAIDAFVALLESTIEFEIERPPGTLVPAKFALGYFQSGPSEVGLAAVFDANATYAYYSDPDHASLFATAAQGGLGDSAGEFGLFLVRPLPEPSSGALLASGALALVALRRRGY